MIAKMGEVLRQMLKRQLLATLVVGLSAFALFGIHGGLSAVAGGGAAVLGGLAASRKLARDVSRKTAGSVLANLLVAEVIKITVIAVVLLLVFKLYTQLIPLALILGLGAAAIMSGAAILNLNDKDKL